MTKYEFACKWIADNDGAGDTPPEMSYNDAMEEVRYLVTTALIADTFNKSTEEVSKLILKNRGFKK